MGDCVSACVCVCVGGRSPGGAFLSHSTSCPEGTRLPFLSRPGGVTPRWAPRGPDVTANPPHPPRAPSTPALRTPRGACHAVRVQVPPERLRSCAPSPSPSPSFWSRADRGCRPSWAPSCSGDGGGFCSGAAAAAAAGARGRSLRSGLRGALETRARRNGARGPVCVLSNYLFIEKKGGGGREKQEVTCPGYTDAKRSSGRRGKQKNEEQETKEEEKAAAEAAAAAAAGDRHPPV